MLSLFNRNWYNDPWRRMQELRREMDHLFGDYTSPRTASFPPVNLWTGDEAVTVSAEVPGVAPEDLDVSASGRTLTIRGERKSPDLAEGATWHRRERKSGSFVRSLDLPFEIDQGKIEAHCTDGILQVRLQRAEASKPRKIPVHS
jgi:HSP20 family protein